MVDKESLERIFQNSVKWWRDHYKEKGFSSNPQDYLDCDAYRSLAVIGKLDKKGVSQLILDNWDEIPGIGYTSLLKEIMGDDFFTPDEMRGKIKEIRAYTLGWLFRYLTE